MLNRPPGSHILDGSTVFSVRKRSLFSHSWSFCNAGTSYVFSCAVQTLALAFPLLASSLQRWGLSPELTHYVSTLSSHPSLLFLWYLTTCIPFPSYICSFVFNEMLLRVHCVLGSSLCSSFLVPGLVSHSQMFLSLNHTCHPQGDVPGTAEGEF